MSLGIGIDIKDLASPALKKRMEKTSGRRLNSFIGPAVAKLCQTHFIGLGPNKRGWPSTRFWSRAAKSTNWQTLVEGVLISVAKIGVRQRYKGGRISPVNKQALTIPISRQAYGHTVAYFPGAFLLRTKKGAWIVQYGGGKRKDATLEFLFKLSPGVDQEPDPNVLPTDDELKATALEAARKAVMG